MITSGVSFSLAQSAQSGARGLQLGTRVTEARSIVFLDPVRDTALEPGKEAVIDLTVAGLPLNADVKKCTGRILPGVRSHAASPDQSSTGVSITGPGSKKEDYTIAVDAPTRPRNVTVRLDGGDVFFRFGDQMTAGEYALPDFSANVNAFLDAYSGPLPVRFRFIVTSDSTGSAEIELDPLDFTRIQTQTWDNAADGTTRAEKSFELDFGDLRDAELLALPIDGSQGKLVALSYDITGEFGPERTLGDATLHHATNEFATISSDFGIAQRVRPEVDAQCTGIALAIANDGATTLYVGLYADLDDLPDSTRPTLAEAQVDVPAGDGTSRWCYATLQAPVMLPPSEPAWIVCRGIQGSARLAIARTEVALLEQLRISRGGHLWRTFSQSDPDAPRGLARLVYLPDAENGAAAVEVVLASASRGVVHATSSLDPTAQTSSQRLTLSGVVAGDHIVASIRSSARGTLTLQKVIQEYA
jgi:hypothetical protein